MPSTAGFIVNCRECINRAVSGRRICTPWYCPSCKCAMINGTISAAEADSVPAGPGSGQNLDGAADHRVNLFLKINSCSGALIRGFIKGGN